ncbi:hypothetical protein FOA52_005776 [Chlamydomonas sp. UWO 241]|nr:hypothetical protein FOA52_005776 [Chlamydomonas sp. UWO 241]
MQTHTQQHRTWLLLASCLAACACSVALAARLPSIDHLLHSAANHTTTTKRPENQRSSRGSVVLGAAGSLGFVPSRESDELSHGHPHPGLLADGDFSPPEAHKSGFGQLRIRTLPGRPDKLSARAAGFLEGWLTAEAIFDHAYNIQYYFDGLGNGTKAIMSWLRCMVAMMMKPQCQMIPRAPGALLLALLLVLLALLLLLPGVLLLGVLGLLLLVLLMVVVLLLQGVLPALLALLLLPGVLLLLVLLARGEVASWVVVQESGLNLLTHGQILLLNALGEVMTELAAKFVSGRSPDVLPSLTPDDAWVRLASSGHCSALIKVAGDLSDITAGHVTWSTYYSMVRIYKHYDFRSMSDPAIVGNRISMSSYPGVISSLDDFYIVGSDAGSMVVMETTNDVLDKSLLDLVTTEGVLSFHRVMAANMLASDGPSWVAYGGMHHSGAYNNHGAFNNQYMVLDLKRFTPGEELRPGLLTVMEMLPGYSESADVTHELEHGYWASYNVPYFPEVYARMGYPATRAALQRRARDTGADYARAVSGLSYQLAPRAKIFRRDAGSVANITGAMALLRSNAAPNDSYSGGDAWATICARGDLVGGLLHRKPVADGCIDGKMTSYAMANAMGALATNGPSADGGAPLFSWEGLAELRETGPHKGMPDVLANSWSLHTPAH